MKNYSYVLIRSLLGGLSNSINRLTINNLPLYPFLFIRHFLILMLSTTIYLRDDKYKKDFLTIKQDKSILWQLIISSTLSSIGMILFYNALKLLPVSIVSIFENAVYTIFAVLLGVVFLKERLPKRTGLYLTLCIIGIMLIVFKGKFELPNVSITGIILLTINAVLASINVTITAVTLKKVSAIGVTTLKSISYVLTSLVFIVIFRENLSGFFDALTIPLVIFVMYGVVSGYLIKFLQNKSVQTLSSSKTAIFQLLTPVVSSVLAMVIFQEWFNLYQYLGMFLIIFCLYKLK